jgi:cytoskeletal protein CcmA (bactofilin family)
MPLFRKHVSSTGLDPAIREALSVVGPGVKVVGDVHCAGVLKIEGQLEGSLYGARQLLLGRRGVVIGNIEAEDVVIGGTVYGNVEASNRVEVQAESIVNGDIRTRTLAFAEGGRVNGCVHTVSDSAEESSEPPRLAATGAD